MNKSKETQVDIELKGNGNLIILVYLATNNTIIIKRNIIER